MVREAWSLGYQPVFIHHRGYGGMRLTSGMTIGCGQWSDVHQVVEHVYNEYCKETKRKIFIVGFSLTGNWVALALGKKPEEMSRMVTACLCVQPPHWVANAYQHM